MSHVADVLDVQAEMKDRLSTNLQFVNMVIGQLKMMADDHSQVVSPDEFANRSFQNMLAAFKIADAYHVTERMTDLVEWVSTQLDETDKFSVNRAPSPTGVVKFDRPILVHDARGLTMKAHLILWHAVRTGISTDGRTYSGNATMVHYFNCLDDPDDYAEGLMKDFGRELLVQNFGRYHLAGSVFIPDGRSLGPAMLTPPEDYELRRDDLLTESIAERYGADQIVHQYTNMQRQVYALWLLFSQKVTRVSKLRAPRAFARRAERADLIPNVTVIDLRASEPVDVEPSTEGRPVNYSHRWIVRGKLQWRHCGQDHEFAEPYEKGWHCRVFVESYIKGPPDKPLRLKNAVYNLRR